MVTAADATPSATRRLTSATTAGTASHAPPAETAATASRTVTQSGAHAQSKFSEQLHRIMAGVHRSMLFLLRFRERWNELSQIRKKCLLFINVILVQF